MRPSQHDQRPMTASALRVRAMSISIRRVGRGGAADESAVEATPDAADVSEESVAFVNKSADEARDVAANDGCDDKTPQAATAVGGVNSRVKDAMTFMRSAPIEKLKQIKDTVSINI